MINRIYEVHIDKDVSEFDDSAAMLKFIDNQREVPYIGIVIHQSMYGKSKVIDYVLRDCSISFSRKLKLDYLYSTTFLSYQWEKLIQSAEAIDRIIYSKWLHEEDVESYDNLCNEVYTMLNAYDYNKDSSKFWNKLKELEDFANSLTDKLSKWL